MSKITKNKRSGAISDQNTPEITKETTPVVPSGLGEEIQAAARRIYPLPDTPSKTDTLADLRDGFEVGAAWALLGRKTETLPQRSSPTEVDDWILDTLFTRRHDLPTKDRHRVEELVYQRRNRTGYYALDHDAKTQPNVCALTTETTPVVPSGMSEETKASIQALRDWANMSDEDLISLDIDACRAHINIIEAALANQETLPTVSSDDEVKKKLDQAAKWAEENVEDCCGTSDIYLAAERAYLAGFESGAILTKKVINRPKSLSLMPEGESDGPAKSHQEISEIRRQELEKIGRAYSEQHQRIAELEAENAKLNKRIEAAWDAKDEETRRADELKAEVERLKSSK
ncbi:hypothetical protein UFOVP1351_46 [uncultured Caudovirales phage]|uniref:Uncharacterized protein n=1 Tax=uncultured Caudovirales phage TaxID=2100421 RepID=A0A6J5RTH5_9CAUD|nr:hypothetical protein UFOVP1351_46 [uncultured Caudovirales phage]